MSEDMQKQERDLWDKFKASTDIDEKDKLLHGAGGINELREKQGKEKWTKWTKEEAQKQGKKGGFFGPSKTIEARIADTLKALEESKKILSAFEKDVIGIDMLKKMDQTTLAEQRFVFTESMTRTIIQAR